ncbi:Cell division protein FtsZ-like protein [Metamycoplasma auris 15026]|uniref:Cell division protein FtsZ n=1 Tax=Metamycoplasma auris 15026 TaxID=1188233 RepID=N9VA73_9BACT|nr:cell division protein FtsZ [Metamycoplasma auris]ENY68588.1 Cell division protein FtsZ-like protein [Metamycoplasma auris 15026]
MSTVEEFNSVAKIKVIGVGGGGNNSIREILNTKIDGLEFIVANTDKQILDKFNKDVTLQLGDHRGIGAGANPEVGKKAADHSAEEIKKRLKDANLVIITAGMGGGTGTGASPVIAKIAKEQGALVIAIVTTPFKFEGTKRNQVALKGIEELKKHVDSYIIISNDKLCEEYGEINFSEAFNIANNIVKQFIHTVISIIAIPGLINLDLADLETLIKDAGETIVGIGNASGDDAAKKAITKAINSPILESSIHGATKAIVYFSSSTKNTIKDFENAINELKNVAGQEIDIMFGVSMQTNENQEKLDETYVSVIATGFKKENNTDDFSDLEETNYNGEDSTREHLIPTSLSSAIKQSHLDDSNVDDNDLIFKNFRN